MTKEERAERRAVVALNHLLTRDVGTRFWTSEEIGAYLREVVANAGFQMEWPKRPLGSSGEMSVMVKWPGARRHHYLHLTYFTRDSGRLAVNAGLRGA